MTGNGLGKIAQILENHPQVAVGRGIVRLECHCAFVMNLCLFQFSQCLQECRNVVMRSDKIRFQRECTTIFGKRFL